MAQDNDASGSLDDQIYILNPFEVTADETEGYSATTTLAGSRLKTDLQDLAGSISVVTQQFLEDTGATDSQSLLVYTGNTEVGGVNGNYAGLGNNSGISDNSTLIAPSQNTRVRGLAEADNTRDYFLTDIPWDSFNVDRVDLSRGPNSILFGVGSPAGIINTSTITASYVNSGELEFRTDDQASLRTSIDVNREIIDNLLAVRIAGLHDDQNFQQKPAYEDDDRIYFALRFEPHVFGKNQSPLSIRANYESGQIRANRPRYIPPYDNVTPWWTNLDQNVYDPQYSWNYHQQLDRGSVTTGFAPEIGIPGLGQQIPGFVSYNPSFYFGSNDVSNAPDYIQQYQINAELGVGPDGMIDQNIQGIVFARLQVPAGLNEFSKNANALDPNLFPGAQKNFYKDRVITDPDVFNFYDNLIDGHNKHEWSDWDAMNVNVAQTFYDNRFGVEFVYDDQKVSRGMEGLMTGNNPFIAADINSYWVVGEEPLTGYDIPDNDDVPPDPSTVTGGTQNPYAGRIFTGGNGLGGNYEETIDRENYRFTAFTELRASDIFEEGSYLERFLGRQRLNFVRSRERVQRDQASWQMWATDADWARATAGSLSLSNPERSISAAIYLTGDMRGTASPNDLHLNGLEGTFDPSGTRQVGYFDQTWNAPGVDPAAEWVRPIDGEVLTQSENPANYVGWTTRPVNILSANNGDKDQLIYSASKNVRKIESVGVTWQGFFMDDLIIPTVGWRNDSVKQYGGESPELDPLTKLKSLDFDLNDDDADFADSETVSWGIVGHSPNFVNRYLPFNSRLSVFYNNSENWQPSVRYGYAGEQLPGSSGKSREYGFALSTMDGRITAKVTWYKTHQYDANIGNVPLGQNAYFLWNLEAWGTAVAITDEAWRRGEAPGQGSFANYAWVDDGYAYDAEELPPEGLDHPSFVTQQAAIQDWYATLPDQAWFDAFGLPVDVAAAKSDDWNVRKNAITDPNWNFYSGPGQIQPAGGGNINGVAPTGTIDQVSKGVEIEVSARLLENWNMTLNVTKTDAYRSDLGQAFTDWIVSRHERYEGPSGDLRLWWAGDQTLRQYFNNNIWSAYEFQLDSIGQAAPEIRPWRFNLVSTYNFNKGALNGLYVGGGYRWEDSVVLGYELNDEQTQYDINSPIKGGSEDAIDLWVGYSHQVTKDVNWRIQLNARNVGDSDHLVPVSVNPDGSTAVARISYGMSWFLTNTFTF